MSNLKAIGPQGLTPEVVYQNFAKELPKLKAVYIVGLYNEEDIDPESGDGSTFYASGNLNDLGFAAVLMNEMARKFICGEVITE